MNLRPLALLVCLAGNVLLAMALVRHGSSPPRAAGTAAKIFTAPNPLLTETSQAGTPAMIDNPAVPAFQWAQIAAPDFALYIEQLRGFGTPEPKIREIIFGAVESIYRPQRGALRHR